MWARLWKKPQALVWEADGVQDTVAMYVRTFLEGAKPDAPVGTRTYVRQLQDALLLSIPAMHSAKYTIATPIAGAQQGLFGEEATGTGGAPQRAGGPALPSVRQGLHVVQPVPAGDDVEG